MAALWASISSAASAVGTAAQSAVSQIAEGLEREAEAMKKKEEEDAEALRVARAAAKEEEAKKKCEEEERGLALQLPWVVDGKADDGLRAAILKISQSDESFMQLPPDLEAVQFASNFNAGEKVKVNRRMLEMDPLLAARRAKLLGGEATESPVTEDDFWLRYWFHVSAARQSHMLRFGLAKLANKSSGDVDRSVADTEEENVGAKLGLEADPDEGSANPSAAGQQPPSVQGDDIGMIRPSGGEGHESDSAEDSGDDLDNFDDEDDAELKNEAVRLPPTARRSEHDHAFEKSPEQQGSPLDELDGLADEFDDLEVLGDGLDDMESLDDLGAEVEDLIETDDF